MFFGTIFIYLIEHYQIEYINVWLIFLSILFLVCWFFYGYVSHRISTSVIETIFYSNLLGVIALVTVLIQLVTIGWWADDGIGYIAVLYLIPSSIIPFALENIGVELPISLIFLMGFLLMILAFVVGYLVYRTNGKRVE